MRNGFRHGANDDVSMAYEGGGVGGEEQVSWQLRRGQQQQRWGQQQPTTSSFAAVSSFLCPQVGLDNNG